MGIPTQVHCSPGSPVNAPGTHPHAEPMTNVPPFNPKKNITGPKHKKPTVLYADEVAVLCLGVLRVACCVLCVVCCVLCVVCCMKQGADRRDRPGMDS